MASFKHTFTSGQTVTPARLNDARDVFDIVNADIKSNAAIALSKLATGALPSGITVASANIVDGTIVNADISASAAIAHSKLANITAGQVLLGNASNVPTATALSGDVTINSSGVTAIGSGVIVDADIKSDAAIAGTKIAPDFGSQNITTSGTATINRPSDHWATSGAFVIGSTPRLGQLDTHGAFETTLTSNGYRDNTAGTNLWKSYGANGQTGAAQVSLNPGGVILFRTEANKATGSSNGVTERMRIQADGNVGIGTSSPGYLLDVAGFVNTNASYRVNNVIVVGPRRTGWTAPTGTFNRGTFDSSTVTLPQLAARVHALIDDLAAHGLIDS